MGSVLRYFLDTGELQWVEIVATNLKEEISNQNPLKEHPQWL